MSRLGRSDPRHRDHQSELALADLQTVENRLTKVERKAQAKDKEAAAEYAVLSKLVEAAAAKAKPPAVWN